MAINQAADLRIFLEAAWKQGEEAGFPIDALMVGDEMFGADRNGRDKTLYIIHECKNAGYFFDYSDNRDLDFTPRGKQFLGK